jgi:thiol-disulfide isomerase/thioredoxin
VSARVKEITSEQFEGEVLRGGSVVLDFYFSKCPPCEAVAPKYEGVSEPY